MQIYILIATVIMINKPIFSYLFQFALLLGMVGIMMIAGNLAITQLSANMLGVPANQVSVALQKTDNAELARWMQTIGAFTIFFIPPIVLAILMSKKPAAFLGFTKIISGKQVFLIILLTIGAMLLAQTVQELNQQIPLPAALMKMAKDLEKEYNASVAAMANLNNIKDYLLALLVIAFFPALFEEVLFRGGFQQIVYGWSKNAWTSILITSIIFSLFHFSILGFLPRLAISIILGWVFYYSKNLWLNILLHFLNNALIVSIMYSMKLKGEIIAEAPKTAQNTMPEFLIWLPVSIMMCYLLLSSFKKESERIISENTIS